MLPITIPDDPPRNEIPPPPKLPQLALPLLVIVFPCMIGFPNPTPMPDPA
jgi:hypothetical protein